ncbi:DsbA family protein [Allosphingosinicella sp.]|uniref:DsbA family protein n=1 Tax=Allosphingosinicella sp. TaxID=2823234 RepID=UPI002FC204D7
MAEISGEPRGAAEGSSSAWRKSLGAGLVGLLIGGAVVALATQSGRLSSDPDRERVERIVRDYLLAHPEVIPEAIEKLQQRQFAQAIGANRAAYETPFAGAWAGAKDGDVVLVEFFDYACGFCRQSNPDIERLLKEDDNLKVVWRELPVLGPGSEAAAAVSLAAARGGDFGEFHDTLFELGRPTEANIAKAKKAVGVTATVSPANVRAELEKNYQLARAVGATGTPTFVVGDQVLQGAVGYEALKTAIGEARAK